MDKFESLTRIFHVIFRKFIDYPLKPLLIFSI